MSLLAIGLALLAEEDGGSDRWRSIIYIVIGAVVIAILIVIGVHTLLTRKKKNDESLRADGFFREETPLPVDDESEHADADTEEDEDLLLSAGLANEEDEGVEGDKNL
ncbi:MAG: hypothetical protein LUD47_01815 [Clostridia bacterium]|nr:hypothetical protein [Clostridia bacterium]